MKPPPFPPIVLPSVGVVVYDGGNSNCDGEYSDGDGSPCAHRHLDTWDQGATWHCLACTAAIEDAATHELKAGDVFVIPAGTGHQFTKIDDHISYLKVRIDPDKVVPLMDEAAARSYLDDR